MRRILAAFVAVTISLSMASCGTGEKHDADSKEAASWFEQYDLGMRYLLSGDYEQAIIALSTAIDIEPKRSEAYLGLAQAYMESGDYEKARQILERGIEQVDNIDDLKSYLEQIDAMQNDENMDDATLEEETSLDEILEISPVFYGEIPITNLSYETDDSQPFNSEEIPEGWIGYTTLHFDLDLSSVPSEISDRIRSHGIWNWDEGEMSAGRAIANCLAGYASWGPRDDSGSAPLTHVDSWGFPTFQKNIGKTYTVCIVLLDEEGKPVAYCLPKAVIGG